MENTEKNIQEKLDHALSNLKKMEETIQFLKLNQEQVSIELSENPELSEKLSNSAKKLGEELDLLEGNMKKITEKNKWYVVWTSSGGLGDDVEQTVLLDTNNKEEAENKQKEWEGNNIGFASKDGVAQCYIYEFSVKEDFEQFKKSFTNDSI